ncbi:hypothetical protein F2P79_024370 [Pimephales promelas]|nr:hypothetical protein F2P79_024370 [Pimephales promelas]
MATPKTSTSLHHRTLPCQQQREIIQPDSKAATGMTFKDLNQLAKNITQFDPNSTEGHSIQAYLQDIDFLLEVRPRMTDRDILYLLRSHIQSRVRSVLDRQPAHVKSNYQLLQSEHGVLVALETKQGRQETPQAYYHRFRQAYFGAHSKPESEEDLNFKTLFLRNLHPGLSRHLGIMACPVTMTLQQLRDLTHKAYIKQKMTSKKGLKTSTVSNSSSQDTSLELEDTQWHDNATVLHQEHRERAPIPMTATTPTTWKSHGPTRRKLLEINECIQKHSMWVKRQRNPPPHHTECVQEHDSLPSEDMSNY